ncbi:(2Fe-2S)-binding protein, partial [Vibrio sp. 10N.222.45.F7]
ILPCICKAKTELSLSNVIHRNKQKSA